MAKSRLCHLFAGVPAVIDQGSYMIIPVSGLPLMHPKLKSRRGQHTLLIPDLFMRCQLKKGGK